MRNKVIRLIWCTVASAAVVMALVVWFGYESANVRYAVLALNAVAFALSLPSSVIVVPVAVAANYYLEIDPLSLGGIYFNTFVLLFVGAVQWFLISPQIAPFETRMQRLGI